MFSSVCLALWQRLLDMPDRPGHAVWRAVGRKTRGFHELTPAYMSEARRYISDVLAWGDWIPGMIRPMLRPAMMQPPPPWGAGPLPCACSGTGMHFGYDVPTCPGEEET